MTSGGTFVTRSYDQNQQINTTSSKKKGSGKFSNHTHVDNSKPFMMATHRTLRSDENPIEIIKEFFKAGGGSLQLTDGKTNPKK